jgi:CheY-like chemotaxis protein
MSVTLPKKILVADDDPVVQKAAQNILIKSGYEVLLAIDGAEAVTAVRHEQPDLILLDLAFPPDPMSGPLSDGFEIVKWLRRFTETATIPIIVISETDPEKYKEQFEDEIVACFQKPLKKKELLQAIQTVLGPK